MRLSSKLLISCILASALSLPARADGHPRPSSSDALVLVSQKQLRSDVEFLTSELCGGRSPAQRGATEAAAWIARRFRQIGLMPFDGHYAWGFKAEGHQCHNIIGMLPVDRSYVEDKYVIVGAHFDNLGTLEGKVYPGADSNASGTAAMLSLAELYRSIRSGGGSVRQNIIFIAFDAKQLSLAGSYAAMDLIESGRLRNPLTGKPISSKDISLMINLDIMGGTSSPIHKENPNYLLMLGARKEHQDLLRFTSYRLNHLIDLKYDYYGSRGFTDMFLNRVSDQRAFREHGIYSVLFTSGITMKTNKVDDDTRNIDIPVLHSRTLLIFRWLERILASL